MPFGHDQVLTLTLDPGPGSTKRIVSMTTLQQIEGKHTEPPLEPPGFPCPFLCGCLPFAGPLSSRDVVESALAETDKETRGARTAPARSKYLMMKNSKVSSTCSPGQKKEKKKR
jgi:hypothetical protein